MKCLPLPAACVCMFFICTFADCALSASQPPVIEELENQSSTRNPIAGHPIRAASAEEIRQAVQEQGYQPVLKEELLKTDRLSKSPISNSHENDIVRAIYEATLNEGQQLSGEVRLEFSASDHRQRRLGYTNLQNLQFTDRQANLTVGQSESQTTYLLVPIDTQQAHGLWTFRGQKQGANTTFDLKLPEAVVSEFRLYAADDVIVSSPNGLVSSRAATSSAAKGLTEWIIYPSHKNELTIQCSSRSQSSLSSQRTFSYTADYTIRADECTGRWNIGLPDMPRNGQVSVQFSREFIPTQVTGPTQKRVAFQWDTDNRTLTIHTPAVGQLSAVMIFGQFPLTMNNQCSLPVLQKGSWKNPNNESGTMSLTSGILRTSFPEGLTVQSSNLTGLMETDVEFTADEDQRITLDQFSPDAAATFQLISPMSVLQDGVVTSATGEAGQVRILIRIENQAGTAEVLHYEVPRRYRITAVSELDTNLPLLFHIDPADNDSLPTQPIDIFLRNPLRRGSRQLLQLTLQSTSSEVDLRDTVLANSDYLRISDIVVLDDTQLPSTFDRSLTSRYSDFRSSHAWLPQEDAGILTLDRRHLPETSRRPSDASEVTATIDHSIFVTENTVNESIQIQLSATPALPSEILLQAADSDELKLSAEDEQRGMSLQRAIGSRTANEWILTLPAEERSPDLTVKLQCSRDVSGECIPMLIQIPSAKIRFAGLTPIQTENNWKLLDSDGQSVTDTIAYPAEIQQRSLRIQSGDDSQQTPQANGMATWILNQADDGLQASVLCQISTFDLANQLTISTHLPISQPCRCLVNGHEVGAVLQDGTLNIVLQESGHPAEIQVLIQDIQIPIDSSSQFQVPNFTLLEVSQQNLDTLIVPPTKFIANQTGKNTTARITDVIGQTLIPVADFDVSSTDMKHFESRLRKRLKENHSVFVSAATDNSSLTFKLVQSETTLIRTVLISTFVFLALTIAIPPGPTSWIVTGIGILCAQGIAIGFPSLASVASVLTAVIAAAGLLTFARSKSPQQSSAIRRPRKRQRRSILSSSIAVVLLTPLHAAGQIPTIQVPSRLASDIPSGTGQDILVPHGDSSVVFVPPNLNPTAAQITGGDDNGLKNSSHPPLLVLDSDVNFRLLRRDSVSVTVSCRVAVDPSVAHQFELPIDDVTLIESFLNHKATLPVMSVHGQPSIDIPASQTQPPLLDPKKKVIASPEPHWTAGLKVHTLSYTVRMVTRPDSRGSQTSLPVPSAPLTKISVVDETNLVTEVEAFTPEPLRGIRLGSQFDYPALSNIQNIELHFEYARNAIDKEQRIQSSTIVARATVGPSNLKVNCEYEVKPVDSKSESVRLQKMPGLVLARAELEDGTQVTPTIDSDLIELPVTVNRLGQQKFRIEWQKTLPFTQQASIDVDSLRQINRIPADRLILVPTTSDRFILKSVSSDRNSLEPLTDAEGPANLNIRPDEGAFLIPSTAGSVNIQLARLLETQEASLRQSAVVEANHIRWSCFCEVQIPDEPIFRQHLSVSERLKIESITARSDDIDRLQSWYRDGDQVVICLREAMRGALKIVVEGTLPRPDQVDTQLPVLTLPPSVTLLESSLELAAADQENVFIGSLGGTIPNAPFDTRSMAIPVESLRLTVTDERRPVSIQADPQTAALADVIAVLSQQNEQTQVSLFIALQSVGPGFNFKFNLPSNLAYATSEVLLLPSEGSVIQSKTTPHAIPVTKEGSLDDNNVSVAVLTGIVPALSNDLITLPLPKFESPCRIQSFQVLDGRNRNGVTAIPRWIRTILPELPDLALLGNTNSLLSTLNETEDQIRIHLPATSKGTGNRSETKTPVYGLIAHLMTGDDSAVTGTTGVLTFSATPNTELKIAIPEDTSVLRVRVDGKLAPAQSSADQSISIDLKPRICFVEIDWLKSAPQPGILAPAKIQVPTAIGIEGSTFAADSLSTQHWNGIQTNSGKTTSGDILKGITTGLQMIGSANLQPDEGGNNEPDNRISGLTDQPVWTELASQSPSTSNTCADFLTQFTDNDNQIQATRFQNGQPAITLIRKIPTRSLLTFFAAVCMIIFGLTTRRITSDPESHSVELTTTVASPTVASPTVPSPAASTSDASPIED